MYFANDWEIDRDTHPDLTYEEGVMAGKADMTFIQQEVNTGGYTLDMYCEIRDRTFTAVYGLNPTEWQRGYADGGDIIAEQIMEFCPELRNEY